MDIRFLGGEGYDEYLEIEENGTVKKYKCLKNARKTIESTATNGKAYAEAMECLAWKVLCNHTVANDEFFQEVTGSNEEKKDNIEYRVHQLDEIYGMIDRLVEKGKEANVWGGCEDDFSDNDGSVLSDLLEYIAEYYEDLDVVDWIETLYQILLWQYQSMHEGVNTYYTNFYGGSEYPVIIQTAKFLQENGYMTVYEQYNKGIVICEQSDNLNEKELMDKDLADRDLNDKDLVAKDIDAWINWHTKEVWEFCVDMLSKHKEEWHWK